MTELCAIFIRQIRERNEDCYEILFKEVQIRKSTRNVLLTVAQRLWSRELCSKYAVTKDQNEEVAQRAADILEERQKLRRRIILAESLGQMT